MTRASEDVVDPPRPARKRLPPPPLNQEGDMPPIESVTAADFDRTAPYTPDRQLTEAANDLVIISVTVEGLGGISDYSVRVELPAFDDNLKAVAQIVYNVHAALFAVNWGPEPDAQSEGDAT